MALHFHKLTVKDIRKETLDCVSIAFNIPAEIETEFKFTQGQTLTLRAELSKEECRRNYSICSSPLDNEVRIAVKQVDGGLFSTFANRELKIGDTLDVMPPNGKFYTNLDASQKKNYMAFAAGSGITPMLSIIKTTLLTEPHSHFTLIYGNRISGSIIFKEELEALKDKFLQRFRIYHVLSRERTEADINYGRIDAEKCSQFSKLIDYNSLDDIFLCGPESMIFSVKEFLEEQGVPNTKIHFELFTTPLRKITGERIFEREKQSNANIGETSKVTVNLDGRSFDFDLQYDSNNILDAALAQGADLPFACKGGVCCTCKAKLVEGEVLMEVNYGLEPDEVAAGFILTCQAHPRTAKVVVDFDQK